MKLNVEPEDYRIAGRVKIRDMVVDVLSPAMTRHDAVLTFRQAQCDARTLAAVVVHQKPTGDFCVVGFGRFNVSD